MKRMLKIYAILLALSLSLCLFAACDKKEAQGSSVVATHSETASNDSGFKENVSGETNSKTTSANKNSSKGNNIVMPVPNPPSEYYTNKTGWPIVRYNTTFEIMGVITPSRGDPEKMSQFKYYEQLTNIKTKYIGVVETKMQERIISAIQSGAMPDAITGYNWTDLELSKYTGGKKPAIVDISKYIDDYAPNIKALFNKNSTIKALNTSADGKVYTIPSAPSVVENYGHWLNVNKKWLEEVGYPKGWVPKTADEFEEMLIAFRDKNPDGDGIDGNHWPFAQWQWDANFIMSWWGPQATIGSIGIDLDGKVYYPYATENAKAAATYWNRIRNTEGLMENFVVNKPDGYYRTFIEYIGTGKIGAFPWSYLQSNYFAPELLQQFVAIPFPSANYKNSELNLSKTANPYNNILKSGSIVITRHCPEIAAMVRYFDYFLTNDGLMLGNWGAPDGTNYRKNKDGTYTITNNELLDDEADYRNAMGWAMGITETYKAIPNLLKIDKTSDKYRNTVYDEYAAAAAATYKKAHKENPVIYMADLPKTAEEIAKLRKYEEFTYQKGALSNYVTGYWKLKDWNKKIEEWNKKDIKGYLKIYQGIVDRNKKNLINTANQ